MTRFKKLAGFGLSLPEAVQQIRTVLLDAAAEGTKTGQWKNLELRFAGGWVRDLLLRIPSNDVDVALSTTTGETFGNFLKAYMESNSHRYNFATNGIGRMYTVKANPDKSKNLETAGMKLMGIDLDFVNLRKEVYSGTSRIPEMQFGTAEEDALRRDATINALFYNLHTDEIEDYTGRGLDDLALGLPRGVLRTPLAPHQTFRDDPLRILRLVRFASRLDFDIDREAEKCMSESTILEALRNKELISRERFGIELDKMLKAGDDKALRALSLIDRIGLYDTIFSDPDVEFSKAIRVDSRRWHLAYHLLHQIMQNTSPRSLKYYLTENQEGHDCWLFAALAPLSQLGDVKVGKEILPYATCVAQKGIKQERKVCNMVSGAARHRAEIVNFKDKIAAGESFADRRDVLGMAIQKWEEKGGKWKLQVLYAVLCEAMERGSEGGAATEQDLEAWNAFLEHIDEQGLMNAPSWTRIIDGKMLQKELGLKSGKWMAEALQVCMAWQFRNPDKVDIDAVVREVREKVKLPER